MNPTERLRKRFLENHRLVCEVMRKVPRNLKGKKREEFIRARLAKLRRRKEDRSDIKSGCQVSGRIGDFIVTISYDEKGKITGDKWEAIPGTNARRATVFDTHAAWAQQYNDYQALKK